MRKKTFHVKIPEKNSFFPHRDRIEKNNHTILYKETQNLLTLTHLFLLYRVLFGSEGLRKSMGSPAYYTSHEVKLCRRQLQLMAQLRCLVEKAPFEP